MKHIFNIFFVHIHNLKSLINNIISINNNCLAFSLFETYFQNKNNYQNEISNA